MYINQSTWMVERSDTGWTLATPDHWPWSIIVHGVHTKPSRYRCAAPRRAFPVCAERVSSRPASDRAHRRSYSPHYLLFKGTRYYVVQFRGRNGARRSLRTVLPPWRSMKLRLTEYGPSSRKFRTGRWHPRIECLDTSVSLVHRSYFYILDGLSFLTSSVNCEIFFNLIWFTFIA